MFGLVMLTKDQHHIRYNYKKEPLICKHNSHDAPARSYWKYEVKFLLLAPYRRDKWKTPGNMRGDEDAYLTLTLPKISRQTSVQIIRHY